MINIKEVNQLLAAASPGPWQVHKQEDGTVVVIVPITPWSDTNQRAYALLSSVPDCTFAAQARTIIPQLLIELQRSQVKIKQLSEFYKRITKLPDCNDCLAAYKCRYKPSPGSPTRINCPLHEPLS